MPQQTGIISSSVPSSPAAVTLPPLPSQPTLFDLLTSESLLQTTRPALKKLVQCLASLPGGGGGRGGEFRRWVTRWGDEVTLLLELCLHYYFLRKQAASFAENFYGLRRLTSTDGEQKTEKKSRFIDLKKKTGYLYD